MTEKEKAKELVEKYANTNGVYGASKRCALIAVDEILNLDYFSIEGREYWTEVKQEIINL